MCELLGMISEILMMKTGVSELSLARRKGVRSLPDVRLLGSEASKVAAPHRQSFLPRSHLATLFSPSHHVVNTIRNKLSCPEAMRVLVEACVASSSCLPFAGRSDQHAKKYDT
jgi:hypothetical protein